MKKGILIIGIAITVFGLTTYGFINERERANTCNEVEEVASCKIGPDVYYSSSILPQISDPQKEQELWYSVKGRYERPTTKENIREAKLISDVVPNYPTKWIGTYTSVEIITFCNGKKMSATSPNDVLSKEQIEILNTVDQSVDIEINVNFKAKNTITNRIENDQFQIVMNVIPSKLANYSTGYDDLITYLKSNSTVEMVVFLQDAQNNIFHSEKMEVYRPTVFFTVGTTGEITNVKMAKTSGNIVVDQSLTEMIRKMPKWNPAKNADGTAEKQDFEFSIGKAGC